MNEEYTEHNFTQCPNCGSEFTISGEVLDAQIMKRKMPDNSHSFLFTFQSLIADNTKTFLSAPMILSFYDACAECGTIYLVHSEVKTAVTGAKQIPPTQFSSS